MKTIFCFHLACEEIKAQPGCEIMRFFPNYLLLKKMMKERLDPSHPGDTRDLTLYENVHNAKIIQLKKETIKHTELLSVIGRLNSNLQAQVRGISSYFKGIASFDQRIANADVEFIRGKLEFFDRKYTELQEKLRVDIKRIMFSMTTFLTAQLVEESVALCAKILTESNPIKAITTGVDIWV